MVKYFETKEGTSLNYLGPDIAEGMLPACFYFALSGEESLSLQPYNSPAMQMQDPQLRIFSLTLPGHGPGFDKQRAMSYWAAEMKKGNHPIEECIEKSAQAVAWLIGQKIIDPHHLAVCGLSRGAFIATHLAAREKAVKYLLAFAPLTRLEEIPEFAEIPSCSSLDLSSLVEELTHLHNIRFYIGNRDRRVGTETSFRFIRRLADHAHEKRARQLHAELFITHSIGHRGHGTAPETFAEGASWLKNKILHPKLLP